MTSWRLVVAVVLLSLTIEPCTGSEFLGEAWRYNMTASKSCAHGALTCLNGGYIDEEACRQRVPCRQTGTTGTRMWQTWELVDDWACRCPPGFAGVDCGLVTHTQNCPSNTHLNFDFNATETPLKAKCAVVLTPFTADLGLRLHHIDLDVDLTGPPGEGIVKFAMQVRNKDEAWHFTPEGGGGPTDDNPGTTSVWDRALGTGETNGTAAQPALSSVDKG